MSISSYQKRKREIAYLEQRIWELQQKAEFFQKAIWEAKKAVGQRLGVEPFADLCGNEESPLIDDRQGLYNVIKKLPLIWHHPGVKESDFLTPENCPEAFK
jgi:hypothetical protein